MTLRDLASKAVPTPASTHEDSALCPGSGFPVAVAWPRISGPGARSGWELSLPHLS
jgi:hypothetical protein